MDYQIGYDDGFAGRDYRGNDAANPRRYAAGYDSGKVDRQSAALDAARQAAPVVPEFMREAAPRQAHNGARFAFARPVEGRDEPWDYEPTPDPAPPPPVAPATIPAGAKFALHDGEDEFIPVDAADLADWLAAAGDGWIPAIDTGSGWRTLTRAEKAALSL